MSDRDQQVRAMFGVKSVRYALACYALDGSPLHLWTVWRVCRKAELKVPPVVLMYLDDVADKLDPTSPSHKREGRIENWIRDAILGENKAPAQTVEQSRMVQRALEMSPNLELNEQHRIDLCLEFGCDESTVRRWLKRARQIIGE